ncbi:TPA: hypothetical protein ACH3X3_015072 [Trebouxia sp. C0006]
MTAASRAAVKTFRSLAGTPEAKCLHTVYVHSHLQSGFTTPTLASASPEVVVPIRPSSSAHAQPYAYWTDGTFVLYNAISGQLRCSQESHKGQCPHIEHVSSHMQENGSDAFDEQDYSQSADAYEEMRNLQLAQAESAEDDDDANATEEEIDKKTKCLGAKNIAV